MKTQTRLGRSDMARLGEDLACHRLQAGGLTVVERNRRFRNGEIDVIARDGGHVVFVEVKTRSGPHFTPCAAVDGRKQHKLRKLALQWMMENECTEVPCRFDVVAVHMRAYPPYDARVEHFRNAF